jgi:hypothetical protein
MSKMYLNLDLLPKKDRVVLEKKYPELIELNISGKERSELTERRIMDVLNIEKPNTSRYDFFYVDTEFELKQAEAYMKQPKFQQVKPSCYDYIICMLNYKDKSEWYLLDTSKISKKSGSKYSEDGKLPLNTQHRNSITEGQITPNKAFKKFAEFIGEYEPLFYYKKDLNLSSNSIFEIFNKIENIIK